MLLVSAIFSLWNVLGARLTRRCDGDYRCPLMLAAYREIGATPLMLVCCAAVCGLKPAGNDRARWFCAGACLWGTQLFFLLGLSLTNADVAALYTPLSQVATTALAFLAGVETYRGKPWSTNARKLAGVGVGLCGGLLIASPHLASAVRGSGGRALGHVALAVGTLASGAYTVAQPALLERNPPLRVAALSYAIAAALMLVTAGAARAPLLALDATDALIVAYAAVAACLVAYSLMAYALTAITPSEVALYGALQPPLTAIFAFIATGEGLPRARDVAGGLLAVAGLVLVALAEGWAAATKAPPPASPPAGVLANPLLGTPGPVESPEAAPDSSPSAAHLSWPSTSGSLTSL